MPRSPFFGVMLFASSLLILLPAVAAGGSRSDAAQLKSSYAANEWHMRRFLLEYLSLEERLVSDPQNPALAKRARELKIQIDLLSRENEQILGLLDGAEPEK